MDKEKRIHLDEKDYLSKGGFKAVYIHPQDENAVIKIPFSKKARKIDVDRELFFRKAYAWRGKTSNIITDYYGICETDQGTGYVFEHIRDDDGRTSTDLGEYLNGIDPDDAVAMDEARALLLDFGRQFLAEQLVVSNVELVNFLVQKKHGKKQIRIIDNLGTPNKLPVAYVFNYFANKRVKKYWKRLVQLLSDDCSVVVTGDFAEKLRELTNEF